MSETIEHDKGLSPKEVATLLGIGLSTFKRDYEDMILNEEFPRPFIDRYLRNNARSQRWSQLAVQNWMAERSR